MFLALLCTCAPALVASGGATGSLLVDSDPPGASVYLDGRLVGDTPVMLPSLEAGVHRVRVVRLGYLENSRLVTVKPGARATLRARLTDPAPQTAQAAALKIVVLEGEGAINVIQQKTAVAPVIEVRDRNDQPVSGAMVRFAIRSGKATFSGSRTVTIATNAAGRASVAGLTPTGAGAVQIGATATFQGQTAIATIVQTNFVTAAQAATAASASGAGGASAAGGAASGGGGISGTTLGIIGAAAAGGTLATVKTLKGGNSEYKGPFSGQSVDVLTVNGSCAITVAHAGTVTLDIQVADNGTVTGTGGVNGTMTVVAGSPGCPNGTVPAPVGSTQSHGCCDTPPGVSGTKASITFSGNHPGGTGTNWFYDFSGAFADPQITGTFTLRTTYAGGVPPTIRSFPVTLTKGQ